MEGTEIREHRMVLHDFPFLAFASGFAGGIVLLCLPCSGQRFFPFRFRYFEGQGHV